MEGKEKGDLPPTLRGEGSCGVGGDPRDSAGSGAMAVILEPPKIKSLTVYIFSLSICHEVIESDAKIFIF